MEIEICGVKFKKIDNETIAVYQSGGVFYKDIKYPARTEKEFIESANYYYVHCY